MDMLSRNRHRCNIGLIYTRKMRDGNWGLGDGQCPHSNSPGIFELEPETLFERSWELISSKCSKIQGLH